jgi:hypothetical protein
VTVSRTAPVFVFSAVTCAPGIAAPDESVTEPLIVPVVNCAIAIDADSAKIAAGNHSVLHAVATRRIPHFFQFVIVALPPIN